MSKNRYRYLKSLVTATVFPLEMNVTMPDLLQGSNSTTSAIILLKFPLIQ
jgi:hypothetical protein